MQSVEQTSRTGTHGQWGRWTPWAWQLAGAGMGFLLAGGQVAGGVSPLGLGYLMACSPGYLLAGGLGVLTGTLILQPSFEALPLLGAALLVLAARLAFRTGFWAGALTGGIFAALFRLIISGQITPAGVGTALLEGGLAVLAGWGMDRLPPQTDQGLCLWLSMAALAIQSLGSGIFQPGVILAGIVLLQVSWQGTGGEIGVLGCCMSGAIALADPQWSYILLLYTGAALAANFIGGENRLACGGVFLAVGTAGASLGGSLEMILAALIGVVAALVGFWLCPVAWRERQELLPAASQKGTLNQATAKLEGIAQALEEIAATVEQVAAREGSRGENYNWVVDYVAEEVCRKCRRREICWNQNYNRTVEGFYHLRPQLEKSLRPAPEELPVEFEGCSSPEKICSALARGYALYRERREARLRSQAMRTVLTEQYGAMASSLAALGDQLSRTGTPEPGKSARVQKLFSSLGLEPLGCMVTREITGKLTVTVTVARMELSSEELEELAGEVGDLCRHPLGLPQVLHCRTVTTLTFCEKPLYIPVFGVAGTPAHQVSGDVTRQFCDGVGKGYMLLCDGMGTGKPAAVDGTLAAQLTTRLLLAGFDSTAAARLVNVALNLKSQEEGSATLDLLTLNLYTGQALLFKAGAAPSFLIRKGKVRILEGNSLPIGILPQVVGSTTPLSLLPGDYLVMISDGVLDDGTEWVMHQLSLCAGRGMDPRQMAQSLIESARRRTGLHHPDDMTAAVCLVEQAY